MSSTAQKILFPEIANLLVAERNPRGDSNKIRVEDHAAHDWYRFVLSFPPHLVRRYAEKFRLDDSHQVLDPFCGTGTTSVECKKLGLPSVGIEANAMAFLAASTKTNWACDADLLWEHSQHIAEKACRQLQNDGIDDNPNAYDFNCRLSRGNLRSLPPDKAKLILSNSISPLPLHKTLVLHDLIKKWEVEPFSKHQQVALAKALVSKIGNLHFGPEVGVGKPKEDAVVVSEWLHNIRAMCADLRVLQTSASCPSPVFHADARDVSNLLKPQSIDAVITSPPYPNEKDYSRTTRLESVLLELVNSKEELRELKKGLLRSNTRGVYKEDDDDLWVRDFSDIQKLACDIENKRIELGKTSGFEKLYARVTLLYFGGMTRHLAELRPVLRPGARLAYVVGDQASYLRVMIRTGQLLAQIAERLGYEVEDIELFRTRLSTATKEQLREEVVLLRWKG